MSVFKYNSYTQKFNYKVMNSNSLSFNACQICTRFITKELE